MARSVGRIEVTVDADTGKLVLQLAKGGEEAGEAAKEAIDEQLGDIGGPELKKALEKVRLQAEKALDQIEAEIGVTLNQGDLRAVEAEIEESLDDVQALVDVAVAADELAAAVEEINEAVSNTEAEITANVSETSLLEVVEEINAAVSHIEAEIDADVSEASLAKAQGELAAAGSSGGKKAGANFAKDFGLGFLDLFSGRMKLIVGAVVALAEPLAVALEGLLGGAIEVVSSAFSALAGAGGALVPIMAGLAGSFVAVGVASLGMGTAIKAVRKELKESAAEGRAFNANAKEIRDAMAQLSPEARATAQAFADMIPTFDALQHVIADQVFAGIDDTLRQLSKETIPDLATALGLAGQSANRFFRELASAAQDIDFADIMAEIQPALDAIGRGFANVIRSIDPFLKAAAPVARELGRMFEQAAASLLDMVQAGAGSGAITKFLDEGLDSLRAWWDLVRNLGSALFTLFEAGKTGGDGLVQSLADIVGKFDEWMKSVEGQNALAEFFETSRKILHDMIPLLQGVQEFFANLLGTGAETRFKHFAEALGDILGVLGDLFHIVGEANVLNTLLDLLVVIGDAIESILPSLEEIAAAFGESLAAAVQFVTPLIKILAVAIEQMTPAIVTLAPAILALAGAFKVMSIVKDIQKALTGFNAALGALALNPTMLAILGITAAVGALFVAFQAFGAKQREINARAHELATGLDDQVGQLLRTADATNAARIAVEALSTTLANTGKDGEKLTKAFGTLNLSIDKSAEVLTEFGTNGDNATNALIEIAEAALGAGKDYSSLVDLVAGTDESFKVLAGASKEMADALGVPQERLAAVALAMEEVQDQSEKTDMDKMIREFLALDAASSDTNIELLKQAEAQTGLNRSGKNLLPLYKKYVDLQAQNAVVTNEAARASEIAAEADQKREEAMKQMQATVQKTIEDVDVMNKALLDQAAANLQLVDSQGNVLKTLDGMDLFFIKAAQAAQKNADAATALGEAYNLLISPALDVQAAWDGLFTNSEALSQALKDNGKDLSAFTEAGRANREQIRQNVQGILDWSTAALKSGEDSGTVASKMEFLRGALANQLTQFGLTKEEADKYIATLGLTPETITTLVSQPGMAQAMTDTSTYVTLTDQASDPVNTDVSAHIGSADAMEHYAEQTDKIPETKETDVSAPGLTTTADAAEHYAETVNKTIPKTQVTSYSAPGLETVQTQLDTYIQTQNRVDDNVSTSYSAPGLSVLTQDVQRLIDKANALDGKVITIHVRQDGTTNFAQGGIVGPGGGIGGEAGSELVTIGGHSMVINRPTALPPGAVVTPINKNGTVPVGKQVNNYMTVVSNSDDPVAVATQVINRAAVLAQG